MPLFPLNPVDEWGGGALYTPPTEYMKVLVSLLSNDGKVLELSTMAKHAFEPELVREKVGEQAHQSLLQVLATHCSRECSQVVFLHLIRITQMDMAAI
jgi:hypothetical protein